MSGTDEGRTANNADIDLNNGVSRSSKLLWRHPAPQSTPMFQFLHYVNQKHGFELANYEELYRWSINHIDKFWDRVWDFVGIRSKRQASKVREYQRCKLKADQT